MHRLLSRSLAALLLLLGACADETEPRTTDDDDAKVLDGGDEPTDDDGDDEEGEEDVGEDDTTAAQDAGGRKPDAGSPSGSGRDGGRGDGGAAVVDAATPVVDAGTPSAGGDAGPVATGGDVPAGDHCAPAAAWDAQAAQFELEVLKLTNEARAVGHNCDTKGMFGPTSPLTMQPQLRCSSRLHSKYMVDTGEFAHDQAATGLDPFERMQAAGYKFSTAGENIAAGQPTPKQVVDGWLDSDGHCSNIMSPGFTEIGVGYAVKAGTGTRPRNMPYWTQNFGKPSTRR